MTDNNESVRGRVVAWMRFHSDGGYEGPIADRECDEARKRSGVWEPLVLQSDLAAASARAEAAEAKLAAMEQDAREIYAQIPGLPVTPETCDAATDVLTRFCIDFNDAIAAQQAEGEDRA